MSETNNHFGRIPPPPDGKKGWPWEIPAKKTIERRKDTDHFPKISIVTPNYNQEEYIEETIRSVLLQRYPNLEFIIIDGGSTDGSVNVIKKYESLLTFWISEPDNGQSHAINKGFSRATGDIFAYLNSDDLYEPGALFTAAGAFSPAVQIHLAAGECTVFVKSKEKRIFKPFWPDRLDYYLEKTFSSTFAQPSAFWSREIYEKVNGFNESLHFCFDRDFFFKIGLKGVKPVIIDKKLSRFREHGTSKTISNVTGFHIDTIAMVHDYAGVLGIAAKRKKRIIKRITSEIEYIHVFEKWRENGRISAFLHFLKMLFQSPALILKRIIIGQSRRILCYRAKNVAKI